MHQRFHRFMYPFIFYLLSYWLYISNSMKIKIQTIQHWSSLTILNILTENCRCIKISLIVINFFFILIQSNTLNFALWSVTFNCVQWTVIISGFLIKFYCQISTLCLKLITVHFWVYWLQTFQINTMFSHLLLQIYF